MTNDRCAKSQQCERSDGSGTGLKAAMNDDEVDPGTNGATLTKPGTTRHAAQLVIRLLPARLSRIEKVLAAVAMPWPDRACCLHITPSVHGSRAAIPPTKTLPTAPA